MLNLNAARKEAVAASILVILLLPAAPSHARRVPPPPDPDILAVNRSLSLSYSSSYLYYNEPSANTGINTGTDYLDYERGNLNGGKAAFSWMTSRDRWYFHGEWTGSEGQIPYTGFTQITLMPASATSRATIQDYDVKIGRGFPTGNKWMLTPYASFGGRHWTRVLGLGSPGNFNETYNHYYWALGSLIQWDPMSGLVVTADAAFGTTIAPTIDDPPDGLNRAGIGTSGIAKIGLELDSRLTRAVHMFTAFDFMGFSYGGSSRFPVPGMPGFMVFEPASTTLTYSVNVGLRYSFAP